MLLYESHIFIAKMAQNNQARGHNRILRKAFRDKIASYVVLNIIRML
jgi:hypothetical protein